MQKLKLMVLVAGLFFALALPAQDDASIEAAKQWFEHYVALEQAYDSGIADLYANAALIKSRRTYPMGDPRDTVIPAASYKPLLRQLMAAAKARGDRNVYSKVNYAREGELVRINAARFSDFRKRTSPVSFLIGRSAAGKWLIYEEFSESQQ